jgi:protoheme IX farnesyltransferase
MNTHPESSLSHWLAFVPSQVRDYWQLTKPRLVFLVLLSSLVGFLLASGDSLKISWLLSMFIGTALVAAGSMALNQWMEREQDVRMSRTANRPLPSGHVEPFEALLFGVILSISGIAILSFTVETMSSFLAALTLAAYLFLYTPLKRKTELCTIVGAIPGALPTLIGWSAAKGALSFEAWILFSIVFLWQMPHFLAIGWMYRKDYANAGFCMLSVTDDDGWRVGRQIILYSLALLPVSLLPTVVGLTGRLYFIGATVSGVAFIYLGMASLRRMDEKAPSLFRASIFYLSCLLVLMVVDKT